MHTVQPCDTKKCNTALAETQVSESLSHFFFAERSSEAHTERWQKALEDDRCVAILKALYAHSACSPTFSLTARCIARLTGLHHQVVRRLIRGDKRSKARLQGLVAWLTGKGRRGTRYWLSPEGAKVAELLAKGLSLGEATLRALATDRRRRKMAHTAKMAHQNGTPSEIYNMPNGFNDVCRRAVTSKPVGKPIGHDEPLSPLVAKLCRDFKIVAWVANDIVQRHSPEAIEAAIELCERRNGQVFNKAGFVIYLLREGFAQAYAEACRRKDEWDEPDLNGIVQALREALSPYGIQVDDEGYAIFPKGRLALPPDPDEAITLLRKLGLLRPEALTDRAASESVLGNQPTHAPTYSTPSLAAEVSELTDEPADSELIDEPTHEPLPEPATSENDATDPSVPACLRCGANGDLQVFEPQPFVRPFVVADDELNRWSGKVLCEACRCYLRVREGKVFFSVVAKRTADPAGGKPPQPADFVDTETWLAWAFAENT